MKTVYLHGALGAEFGTKHKFDVTCPAEAVRALCSQMKGFEQRLRDGAWRLVRGDIADGFACTADDLTLGFGRVLDFHIVPEIAGGKGRGLGKAILGIAIIAVTWGAGAALMPGVVGFGSVMNATAFTAFGASVSFGQIAMVGASMALGGVAQMLSPVPGVGDYGNREAVDQRASFLFNGAVNVSEQGAAVPLVFGRFRTGSVVVSAGLVTEQLNTCEILNFCSGLK